MAVIFQTTDITNTSVSNEIYSDTGSPSVTIASGDEVIVARNVFLGSGAGIVDLANATQFDLTFLGTGYSIGTALRMDLNTSQTSDFDFDYRIHIGPDASITSREAIGFIGVLSTASGIRDAGAKVEFVNDGTMASISNSGLSFQTIGVATLTNNGAISSADTNNAVSFKNIGTATLLNTGDIITQNIGTGTFSAAINFASSTENSYFVNTGSVTSVGSAYYSSASASEYFANSGTITGRIDTSTVTETEMFNTGTIIGDVDTNFGNDIVVNTGIIQGILELGGDDDTYQASGGGLVTGQVLGDSGDDTLKGGSGDDKFNGGADIDILFGNSGNDDLNGGDDDDVINGNSGEDVLEGGAGIDKLVGGKGNDDLAGGADRDNLFGGNGADVFDFNDVSDSINGATDAIRDFNRGVDVIDLVDTTGLNILFNGTSGFLGGGDASVYYNVNGKGQAIVRVDTDGDAVEDMRIQVNNTVELDLADFAL